MKTLRQLVPVVMTLVVLALFGWFLVKNADYVANHYRLNLGLLLLIVVLTAAVFLVRSVTNKMFFAAFAVGASLKSWIYLTIVSTMTNYLPLSAGLLAKGMLLKRLYSLSYRVYALAQVLLFILFFVCNGAVGFIVVEIWMGGWSQWIIQIVFLSMIGSAVIFVLPERLLLLARSQLETLPSALVQVRNVAPAVIASQVVLLMLLAAKLYLCFRLGEKDVPYSACLVFTAATILTRLTSITPGSIGLRELLIGALADLTGFGARDALIAATIDRLVEMVVVFGIGSYATWKVSREVTQAPVE